MKIVLISFLYEPALGGGAAQVAYSLAKDLANQGTEVTVITSAPVRQPMIEQQNGIKIIRFSPRNLYWVYEKETQPVHKKIVWQLIDLWNPFVFRAMRGLLSMERPDIVHVHKLRGLSPSVWNASSAAGVPVLVHTCHDYELISPEGWLNGRVGQWAKKRSLMMRPYQDLRARCSNQVQLASAPSQYVLKMHNQMGFFRKAKCQVIPNSHGLGQEDLAQIREISKNKAVHPLCLLFMGRLVSEKGIESLCKAFLDCLAHHPEIRLDIAGWGPLEDSLKNQFGAISQIYFHGAVFDEEKAQLLRTCDLFVLPSTGPDNFPVAIAEAFAFGKPVLASRIGGIPEVIQDGETGFLVEPGNIQELSERICQIAEEPGCLKMMQAACFEAALRYSSERVLAQYLNFYEEAL